MGKHNIEKNTVLYWLTYRLAIGLHNLFYREFYVINRPNKQDEKPSIITPNHQNALMDALAVLFAKSEPLVFLARSDIFKKKAVAAILYFLKILPVYRIRDGFDSLKNNQETFDHTVRVLSAGRGLVILPEGNHFGAKTLRPLKKGFARIAFMTEINGNEQIDVHIVPTAIDYTAYDTFFTRLTVVFGEPFPLKPFLADYKEKPQVALNDITKKLAGELKKHIIHIESGTHYNACLLASAVYAEHKTVGKAHKDQQKRFETQRNVTQMLNRIETEDKEAFDEVVQPAHEIQQATGKLPHEIVGQPPRASSLVGLLLSIMLVPLALPGTIIFGAFWYWPVIFTNKKIEDVQFRTSVRYVLYIVQYILLLAGILIYLLIAYPLKSAALIFLTAVLSGVLSMKIWRMLYWFALKARWYLLSRKNKQVMHQRSTMLSIIEKLLKK